MRIGGIIVNKIIARYDYRCAECLGALEYWNAGLRCRADHAHRNFVHKRDVAEIQAMRKQQLADVEAAYEIVDGQLRPKERIF
jgi:hypothetical protein